MCCLFPRLCVIWALAGNSWAQAENEAKRRGCLGAWLDTFSFQAREFDERVGYTVFGTITDCPPGHSRFFLKKALDPQSGALHDKRSPATLGQNATSMRLPVTRHAGDAPSGQVSYFQKAKWAF
jgi:hypothetical protein